MNIAVLIQTKPSEVNRKMALEMIDYLVQAFSETDGVPPHLTVDELKNGAIIFKKLKKFVNKEGNQIDEMRGTVLRLEAKIIHLEASLSMEIDARKSLQIQVASLQIQVASLQIQGQNSLSLVKAFDLIKLFRFYYLSSYDWERVTSEYARDKNELENRCITELQFNQKKAIFNANYPMPPNTPLLSDVIDVCQERHEQAHSGLIKTIVKQEKFIDDCMVYFGTEPISEGIANVCIPILMKMNDLKTSGQLRGL